MYRTIFHVQTKINGWWSGKNRTDSAYTFLYDVFVFLFHFFFHFLFIIPIYLRACDVSTYPSFALLRGPFIWQVNEPERINDAWRSTITQMVNTNFICVWTYSRVNCALFWFNMFQCWFILYSPFSSEKLYSGNSVIRSWLRLCTVRYVRMKF